MNAIKNYSIMLIDPPWAGPIAEFISGPDVEVNHGRKIGGVSEPFIFRLVVDAKASDPQGYPPCDIHRPLKRMIVSEKVIEIFNQCDVKNVEYFDADVSCDYVSETPRYKVANIVGAVNALDDQKSEVVKGRRGGVLSISRLALNESCLAAAEHKIVRLMEDNNLMVVHRSLREELERHHCTGFRFVTDEEWTPGQM